MRDRTSSTAYAHDERSQGGVVPGYAHATVLLLLGAVPGLLLGVGALRRAPNRPSVRIALVAALGVVIVTAGVIVYGLLVP